MNIAKGLQNDGMYIAVLYWGNCGSVCCDVGCCVCVCEQRRKGIAMFETIAYCLIGSLLGTIAGTIVGMVFGKMNNHKRG